MRLICKQWQASLKLLFFLLGRSRGESAADLEETWWQVSDAWSRNRKGLGYTRWQNFPSCKTAQLLYTASACTKQSQTESPAHQTRCWELMSDDNGWYELCGVWRHEYHQHFPWTAQMRPLTLKDSTYFSPGFQRSQLKTNELWATFLYSDHLTFCLPVLKVCLPSIFSAVSRYL